MTIAANIEQDVIVCTKSTVPVGTNAKIKQLLEMYKSAYLRTDVVSNPEFLREGSAIMTSITEIELSLEPKMMRAPTIVEQLYLPLNIPIIKTDIKSAEMIKYASNAFLATKISFINEIAALCEKVGAKSMKSQKGLAKIAESVHNFFKQGLAMVGHVFRKIRKHSLVLLGMSSIHLNYWNPSLK